LANNPIGVAAIEAIGMLGWPGEKLKILSIGTINEPGKLPRLRGKLPMAASVARLFMAGQAHSALGTAKIITGDVHQRKAIWRIDQTAPEGRYTLDNAGRISEMRDRAFAEAREQLPEFTQHFFGAPADEFVPFHVLGRIRPKGLTKMWFVRTGGAKGGEADSGKLSSSYVMLPIVFPYLISPSSFCLSS
jgi:hypothetical protein